MTPDLDQGLHDLAVSAGAQGHLPDAAQLRRRGDRRRHRHQAAAVTSALVAAATVVLAVGHLGGPGLDPDPHPFTPATSTPRPTGSSSIPTSTPRGSSSPGPTAPATLEEGLVTIKAPSSDAAPHFVVVNPHGKVDVTGLEQNTYTRIYLRPDARATPEPGVFSLLYPLAADKFTAYCFAIESPQAITLAACDQNDPAQLFEFTPKGKGFMIVGKNGPLVVTKYLEVQTSTGNQPPTVFTLGRTR